jgi:hypothetical protein
MCFDSFFVRAGNFAPQVFKNYGLSLTHTRLLVRVGVVMAEQV